MAGIVLSPVSYPASPQCPYEAHTLRSHSTGEETEARASELVGGEDLNPGRRRPTLWTAFLLRLAVPVPPWGPPQLM